jgi:hypothetical protein
MTKQRRNAASLVREGCANYYEGMCLPHDVRCVQAHTHAVVCRYFADSVLPQDAAMYAEATESVKICATCHSPFRSTQSRAKTCFRCEMAGGSEA